MVVWLRPEYILAFVTSLYCCSQLVLSKTYDNFWCTTAEGVHQISCLDDNALLTDITIIKVYRRAQTCEPEFHSEYLAHCQSYVDGSACEGNKTCSVEISSRDVVECEDKTYTPTYFYIKYTCTQIHTMCTDTTPVRNTLHGFILSPAYPHPMADNLKCSITIEVDPSMHIEISPIQIRLQEAIKCRGEYIEIFGYSPVIDEKDVIKNNNWKEYHTWCGGDRSVNNPPTNARYLIPSSSLYVSLQTSNSGQPRSFKIRYKVVPSSARAEYNSEGIAYDLPNKGFKSSIMMPATMSTIDKTPKLSLNNSDVRNFNETSPKRTIKKGILIGIIVAAIVLVIAIIVGVAAFILIKRRRSSSAASNNRKKNLSPTTSNNPSKSTAKSPDKAPLLEKNNTTSTNMTKQKLVPERTVQIADATTSRFKPTESSATKPGSANAENPPSKPPLTAVDSGIYGVDLPQDSVVISKTISQPISDSPKPPLEDIPDVSEPLPTIVVNPLSENTIIAATVESNDVEQKDSSKNENEEQTMLIDNTVQSAYPRLVNIASSESDGTLCGSGLESRRASVLNQPVVVPDITDLETCVISDETKSLVHHPIPFNPLHVILQKDANKYYTTEYI